MRLEAEQVTKQYQTDPKKARFTYALSGTDLVVESGEFAVITGKSGSGKSTLLHILAGLLQPTSGCVLAGGKDLYRMADGELSKFRNENIAVIPQGGGAIYSLTAEENIRLARNICGRKEEKDILPLMKELGIEQLKDAYPSELSGGELRRVAIARALFQGTGILLADEPTSDLDEENTDIVAKLLRRAADSGKTVFVVTHEMDMLPYADSHYIMKEGVLRKADEKIKAISCEMSAISR